MNKIKSKINSFKNAVYCYEEILLINPTKFEFYQKLAELHFSLGSLESLITARKYLCFLLTLNPLSYRTLYALNMTCSLLIKKEKKNITNQKIIDVCSRKLNGMKKF